MCTVYANQDSLVQPMFQHADATVLELNGSAALERVQVAVGGQAQRVPEAQRRLSQVESHVKSAVSIQHISTGKEPYEYLCTQLVFEGTQRRSSVIGPVTPGASGQAILSSVIRLGFHV